jgi:hypothetical protein
MKYQVDKYFGSPEKLLKRYGNADSEYHLWESMHREAMDYSMPERNTFRIRSPGKKENRHVFDSTAVEGLDIFVNKVQSGFFPDWLEWMNFRAGVEIPEENIEQVEEDLEKITRMFFGHFHQSNFSTEITPTLKDWGIGTGCIEVSEGVIGSDDSLFQFTNVPLPELKLENTASGPIRSSWRDFELELEQVMINWPQADLSLGMKKKLEKNPMEKVHLIDGHLYNPSDKKYYQYVLESKSKHVIYSQSFKTKRRIVFRATKTPGEVYGRGPIIRLLPDIQTVNKIVEFYLKQAALHVAGMYTAVDDGVINPFALKIEPGVVIPVSSNNSQNPTLSRMALAGDIGLSQLVLKDIQDRINRSLMAEPMGDVNDPVKSATEQMLRHQDDMRRSSTSHGRLYSEMIIPMIRACVDIARNRGKLPDIVVNGKQVKVKMVSPLAKQKEMEDFANSQTYYAMIQQLPIEVQMGTVKLEKFPRYWAEKLAVPLELVRSEDEQKALGAAMQQASLEINTEGGGQPQ